LLEGVDVVKRETGFAFRKPDVVVESLIPDKIEMSMCGRNPFNTFNIGQELLPNQPIIQA
jgi:hypothetical protein